jgi:hypothetical protein
MIEIRRNKAAWLILLMALSFAFFPVAAVAQVAWIKGFDAADSQSSWNVKD